VANHLQRAKGKWPVTCKEQKNGGQPPAKIKILVASHQQRAKD